MGKRTKISFDVNNIFLEAAHTPASKAEFMRSELWPVAVSIYALTEGVSKIGPITHGSRVHLMTDGGFSIGSIDVVTPGGTPKYRVLTADGLFCKDSEYVGASYSSRLETVNPRYICQQLRPASTHSTKNYMLDAAKQASLGVSKLIESSLSNLCYKLDISSKPKVHIHDSDLITAMMYLTFGNSNNVAPQDRQRIQNLYTKHLDDISKFLKNVERLENLFTTDKWILCRNSAGGVVVGAISRHPLQVAMQNFKSYGSFTGGGPFNFADVIVPFQWYKTYEDIPIEIRTELDISLMMLKNHMNKPDIGEIDDTTVWDGVEAFCIKEWVTGNVPVFVLPK